MKRENIKLANELDNQILNIESQIEIWKKSDSLYGSGGNIKIKEIGVVGKSYEINLEDIPFEKLKNLFLDHYKEQKKIKEEELECILFGHY